MQKLSLLFLFLVTPVAWAEPFTSMKEFVEAIEEVEAMRPTFQILTDGPRRVRLVRRINDTANRPPAVAELNRGLSVAERVELANRLTPFLNTAGVGTSEDMRWDIRPARLALWGVGVLVQDLKKEPPDPNAKTEALVSKLREKVQLTDQPDPERQDAQTFLAALEPAKPAVKKTAPPPKPPPRPKQKVPPAKPVVPVVKAPTPPPPAAPAPPPNPMDPETIFSELRSDSPTQRRDAARRLGKLKPSSLEGHGPRLAVLVLEALEDPSTEVRTAMTESLHALFVGEHFVKVPAWFRESSAIQGQLITNLAQESPRLAQVARALIEAIPPRYWSRDVGLVAPAIETLRSDRCNRSCAQAVLTHLLPIDWTTVPFGTYLNFLDQLVDEQGKPKHRFTDDELRLLRLPLQYTATPFPPEAAIDPAMASPILQRLLNSPNEEARLIGYRGIAKLYQDRPLPPEVQNDLIAFVVKYRGWTGFGSPAARQAAALLRSRDVVVDETTPLPPRARPPCDGYEAAGGG